MRVLQYLCCILVLLMGSAALAADMADVRLLPATDDLFASGDDVPTVTPPEGKVLVIGLFNDPRLSIEDINQITVLAADDVQVPLTIESDSVFYEFDRIVSLRFFFFIDAALAEDPTTRFTLLWGSDVSAENAKISKVIIDPEIRTRVRRFQWGNTDHSGGAAAQIASIEVIADTTAGYHFLWYLLPMALIFALLTIRKLGSRRPVE